MSESTKDLVDAFYMRMLLKMEIIYGNAHTDWWNREGKEQFYIWAKKQGIEFTNNDFDIPKNPMTNLRREILTIIGERDEMRYL